MSTLNDQLARRCAAEVVKPMKQNDAVQWFESIAQDGRRVTEGSRSMGYDDRSVAAWVAEASSAVDAVFSIGHAIHKTWANAKAPGIHALIEPQLFHAAVGVIETALKLLRDGRISTLVDGIRAETIDELLDQAEVLLRARHDVAASVIAGGALETHLLHLCDKNDITWDGDGSINTYNSAIARERKQGNEIYAKSYGSLITGWGQIRNDAAHSPGEFRHSSDEVKSMADGIRQFAAAVP